MVAFFEYFLLFFIQKELVMQVGLFGFGRAGRSVASVLLESKKTNLRWVIRQTNRLNHRSVPEFLGVTPRKTGGR